MAQQLPEKDEGLTVVVRDGALKEPGDRVEPGVWVRWTVMARGPGRGTSRAVMMSTSAKVIEFRLEVVVGQRKSARVGR